MARGACRVMHYVYPPAVRRAGRHFLQPAQPPCSRAHGCSPRSRATICQCRLPVVQSLHGSARCPWFRAGALLSFCEPISGLVARGPSARRVASCKISSPAVVSQPSASESIVESTPQKWLQFLALLSCVCIGRPVNRFHDGFRIQMERQRGVETAFRDEKYAHAHSTLCRP